jgi:hypothetical protein
METALTYTLQRVHWQVFGTLTFKSARLLERVRLTMFFALLRRLGRWHKVPFRKCVWALRQESGEIGGRLHFHFLIASLPSYAVQVATCMSIKAQWEKFGGGMARVREYDSRRQGLEYTLKCLKVAGGGANLYEVGKFSDSADEVMLSNSIWDPVNLDRASDTLVTA